MKKIVLNLFLLASTITFLISCENANTEPVGSVVKEINIVQPDATTNLVLSANFANQTATTIKWSGADFGYSAAVKYKLQITLASNPDYANAKIIDLGSFNEKSLSDHEFPITHKDLNLILTGLGGSIGNTVVFKMKISGNPDVQLATNPNALFANSQEVTFSASVYDKFDETFKIYVPGNFGAASTFADWNVDNAGTSNSPAIYKPLETSNEYNGFVYMNNTVPQFKFANPDGTNLNIKGIDSAQPTASGLYSGSIKDVTDVNDPNNITITVGTAANSGVGTYYLTADFVTKKYTIIKRKFTLSGPAVNANAIKDLSFVTDSNSPYYRMYANNNIKLVAGLFKIGLKTNSPVSPAAESLGTSIANTNQNLMISPDAMSSINNKMSIGGGFFNVQNPGTYTIVLDTKNSANFNLRVIPN